MPLSHTSQLVNKSINSMVSAIELYNKPDFKYREELFCITAVNAWELLLKAKILQNNANKISNLFIIENIKDQHGKKTKRWKYKENRAHNKMTIDILVAMRRLLAEGAIDQVCYANIETLLEFRDNAVHFYNIDALLAQKIQEVGAATLKSYIGLVDEWFSISLARYNFYLMPLSFFHPEKAELLVLGRRDVAVANLLKYIAEKEKLYPSNPKSRHSLTLTIEARMVKPSSENAQTIRIGADPSAPEYRLRPEEIPRNFLTYEQLTRKCQSRYTNFKVNGTYRDIRRSLEQNETYCFHYPLNPNKSNGAEKLYYNPRIFEEFDKHYQVIP